MNRRMTSGALLALCLVLALSVAAVAGRSSLKINVRGSRGAVGPGEDAHVSVLLRNRTKVQKNVDVELFRGGESEPVASESVGLDPRGRAWLEFDVEVPSDHPGGRLLVTARADDAEGHAFLHVRTVERRRGGDDDDDDDDDEGDEGDEGDDDDAPPPSGDDAQWLAGKALYLSSCAGCHGATGARLLREDLGDWLEAVREGEDDMPAFPGIGRDDVIAMRLYVSDPDRIVDPTEPPPVEPPPTEPPPASGGPTWESDVAGIMAASCNSCHNQNFAAKGVRTDTYAEAYANRNGIVGTVEAGTMPTTGALPAAQQSILRAWLDAGAPER